MVTSRSSKGWRITSKTERLNSGSSSKNKTPLWAKEISPGWGYCPPPTKATSEMVWWGDRKGRIEISPCWLLRPTTEWILVVSKASRSVKGGKIEDKRLANMVFPAPGGPINIILCPPAAAISIHRLTLSCPRTSEKSCSVYFSCSAKILRVSTSKGCKSLSPLKN